MYDQPFYDMIRPGVQDSAAALVPLLMSLFSPTSVLDVGCGEGWWASAFEDAGVASIIGIDGPENADGHRLVSRFHGADLSAGQWPAIGARSDLVLCLEVAEHLPAERAEWLVERLCFSTTEDGVVVFSAAIPGQGGVGHVNEQWPAYWADLFWKQWFMASGALRLRIWDDDRIENWYRQNLLVATRSPYAYPRVDWHSPAAAPLPLVHPVLFEHTHFKNRRRR